MRKLAPLLIVLLLVVPLLAAGTYTTSFPSTENPLSESGNWVAGSIAGTLNTNVATTTNFAHGTQSPASGLFDDSLAVLTGSWGATQSCILTVAVPVADNNNLHQKEIECLMRATLTAGSPGTHTAYECTFSIINSNPYRQVNYLHGTTFTQLTSNGGGSLAVGDQVKCTISGSTITLYECPASAGFACTQVHQDTDSNILSGSIGIGFYNSCSSGCANTDFGISAASLSDGTVNPPPSSNPHRMRFFRRDLE